MTMSRREKAHDVMQDPCYGEAGLTRRGNVIEDSELSIKRKDTRDITSPNFHFVILDASI